ncbi:MAG: hypothetical protein R2828_21160 [Saprospiraceae bacterium]
MPAFPFSPHQNALWRHHQGRQRAFVFQAVHTPSIAAIQPIWLDGCNRRGDKAGLPVSWR